MTERKKYSGVIEMLEGIGTEKEFIDELKTEIAIERLVEATKRLADVIESGFVTGSRGFIANTLVLLEAKNYGRSALSTYEAARQREAEQQAALITPEWLGTIGEKHQEGYRFRCNDGRLYEVRCDGSEWCLLRVIDRHARVIKEVSTQGELLALLKALGWEGKRDDN